MKTPLFLAVLVTTLVINIGCQSERPRTSERIVPLYDSCIDVLGAYSDMAKERFGVQISTKLFSKEGGYKAHPYLVGVAFLSTSGNQEKLQTVENGLEVLCFPIDNLTLEADTSGIKILRETLRSNLAAGKKENYLILEDDQLKLYFNNSQEAMKRNLLQ